MGAIVEILAAVSALALGALSGYITHSLIPAWSPLWHVGLGLAVSVALATLHYATGLRSLLGIRNDLAQLENYKLENERLKGVLEDRDRTIETNVTDESLRALGTRSIISKYTKYPPTGPK